MAARGRVPEPVVDSEPFLRRVERLGPGPSRLDPVIRAVLRLAAGVCSLSVRVEGLEHVRAAVDASRRDGGRGLVLAGVPHVPGWTRCSSSSPGPHGRRASSGWATAP